MDDTADAPSPQLERPSEATILAQWTSFFSDPLLSLPHLKQKALAGEVSSRGLRSLHWRVSPSPAPSALSIRANALGSSTSSPSCPHLPPHPRQRPRATPFSSSALAQSTRSCATATFALPMAAGSTMESRREQARDLE